MKEHPLQRFWQEMIENEWLDGKHPVPEADDDHGAICIDSWNAAIKAALECVVEDGNPVVAKEKIRELGYSGATY